jgi:hypothetical protein
VGRVFGISLPGLTGAEWDGGVSRAVADGRDQDRDDRQWRQHAGRGETRAFGVTWDATFLAIRSASPYILPTPPQTFGIRAYTWERLGGYVTRYTPPWVDASTTVELVEGMNISLRGRYLLTRDLNHPAVLHDTLLRQSHVIEPSVALAVMSLDGRTLVYLRDGGVCVLPMNVPADGRVPDGERLEHHGR